jgi:hypothetical protein
MLVTTPGNVPTNSRYIQCCLPLKIIRMKFRAAFWVSWINLAYIKVCAVHLFGWTMFVRKLSLHIHTYTHTHTHSWGVTISGTLYYFPCVSGPCSIGHLATTPQGKSSILCGLCGIRLPQLPADARETAVPYSRNQGYESFKCQKLIKKMWPLFFLRTTCCKLNITFFLGMMPYSLVARFPSSFV